ncbi:hypothetical protein Rsub_11019 [Raphidocelis subcapitata]|uniref:Uncharacterized protein n=1 Tax=Raphidocelis subcapitata TaxID=307507 RepID=A0A2V0PEH4_9CHLO|nr:hypothetical protein Rsub_11019 [Raphidocelis subcapitata]|eukprot:GBF97372.1 hypothetical protein Rsub_11019 [Raphidocelis subcapitata]
MDPRMFGGAGAGHNAQSGAGERDAAARSPAPTAPDGGAPHAAPGPGASGSTGYSPASNPFGERPANRTSAGAAVRLSGSELPTPGAFTPTSAVDGGGYLPTPASSYGGSNLMTPGAGASPGGATIPGWSTPGAEGAGSSTKPHGGWQQQQQQQGWQQPQQQQWQQQQQQWSGSQQQAGEPSPGSWLTGAPVATPSDVTPTSFGSRARGAAPIPSPSALLGGGGGGSATRSAAASGAPEPAASAAASAAAPPPAPAQARPSDGSAGGEPSGLSLGSADSHERFGGSPTDLLRKAASKMRSQAAVSGSSHLPPPQKGAGLYLGKATPEGKGVPALKAPTNTPATPAVEATDTRPRGGAADQQSPSGGFGPDAGSVSLRMRAASGAAGGSPAAAAAARQSPPQPSGSHGSVVSFGSHCTPAPVPAAFGSPQGTPSPSRALDFSVVTPPPPKDDASGAAAAPPAASPAGRAGGGGPVALEALLASLQDPATRDSAAEIFAGELRSGRRGRGAGGPAEAAGAPADAPPRGGRAAAAARRAGRALLVLALLAGAALAVDRAAQLPEAAAPPRCAASDARACVEAYGAFFSRDPAAPLPAWRAAALGARWAVEDWWGYYVSPGGRLPGSVDGDGGAPPPQLPGLSPELLARAERFVRERDFRGRPEAGTGPAAPPEAADAPAPEAGPGSIPTPPEQQPPAAAEDAAQEPAPAAPPASLWRPAKSPDACPAWLPLHSLGACFADCRFDAAAFATAAAAARPATDAAFAAHDAPGACSAPGLPPPPADACVAAVGARAGKGAAAAAPAPRGWLRAVLRGLWVLFAAAAALVSGAAVAVGAVLLLLQGSGGQWLAGELDESGAPAASPVPRAVASAAAAAATAVAAGARVLTPRFKAPKPPSVLGMEHDSVADADADADGDPSELPSPQPARGAGLRRGSGAPAAAQRRSASAAARGAAAAAAAAAEEGEEEGELASPTRSAGGGARRQRSAATPRRVSGLKALEEGGASHSDGDDAPAAPPSRGARTAPRGARARGGAADGAEPSPPPLRMTTRRMSTAA